MRSLRLAPFFIAVGLLAASCLLEGCAGKDQHGAEEPGGGGANPMSNFSEGVGLPMVGIDDPSGPLASSDSSLVMIDAANELTTETLVAGRKTRGVGMAGGVPSYISNTFMESAIFGASLTDPKTVVIRQKNLLNGAWVNSDFIFSTSYEVEQSAPMGKGLFYFLGTAPGGECVIERWKRRLVGMPGSGQLVFSRKEIYRGTSLGTVASFGTDPENRFLLVLHGSPRTLSKISLSPGNAVIPIYDSSVIPMLDDDICCIQAFDYAAIGRIWGLLALNGGYVVLRDTDNDGGFETWEELSSDDYEALYPRSAMVADYVFY